MVTSRRDFLKVGTAALACALALAAGAGAADLSEDFVRLPDDARPLTWWHWLNGNITKEGITADLEAMKRAGLGGCYLFNCGGKYPEGDVRFMQPKWLDMMDHTVREAGRLGLKFGVHNCDGFSQSGGPWITPETSMKVLTWTAADADGGKPFEARLAQPETQEGFYRDIAVIAFPLPEGGPLAGARLSGTLPAGELAKLVDGREATRATFPVPAVTNVVEFTFDGPRVVRSLSMRNAVPHRWEDDFEMRLEASDDGVAFCTAGEFTANWDYVAGDRMTAAFADTTGRVFRVAFKNPVPIQIGDIELSGAAKAHFAEAKAARLRSRGHGGEARHLRGYPGPDRHRPLAAGRVVDPAAVCDLTAQMTADGVLKWTPPAGRWRVLRIGFTSNGHYVSPATPEGRGLECDKLDPTVVRFHLDQYVGKLLARYGSAVGKTFTAVEIDSWECGIQNWTGGFEKRFRERVGYDLTPYWPVLLEGWIVGDADRTERVLWDWRRFLADQIASCHFGVAADYLKAKGLTYVGESTGRQQYLYDVAYIRNSDVPMGEFWVDAGPGQGVRVDNKVASSIAHVAGKRVVAAEAYTSGPGVAKWQNHPYSLKAEGDQAFCAGVNQFVFHTFAHQPYEATGPGFTFFFWGLNFNRGNTWWPEADAWLAYLTRCNRLLREGQQVCDVLWFVGEDVPNRIAWRDELKLSLPAGHDFDGCDVASFLQARVDNGRIALPSGATYRVLLLPDLPAMRPAVARKVRELAEAGAAIVAPRLPTQSPALADLGAGDAAVRADMAALQGGACLLYDAFGPAFERLGLARDFEFRNATPNAEILYVHRRVGETDLYFVANQQARPESFDALFRVAGKAPELWDPASGSIVRPGVFGTEKGGRTCLPMRLDPNGSVFVVFRQTAPARHAVALETPAAARAGDEPSATLGYDAAGKLVARRTRDAAVTVRFSDAAVRDLGAVSPALPPPVALDGAWQLAFTPHLGAPASATFGALISWPDHADASVRHFSGTATYTKTFELPAALFGKALELTLDLGRVEVIAQATLNGRSLPTLWKPPFRACVDGIARPGSNTLEVRVTNLWPNRLIGDAALPDDVAWQAGGRGQALPEAWPEWLVKGQPRPSGRIAFCTRRDVYGKRDPLLPSGLLGPVTFSAAALQPVE